MDRGLLVKILEIPTYFGREELIKEFLISYFKEKNYKYHLDEKGNLYVHKGESEFYPCVCSHLDSVHTDMISLITENKRKKIVEKENKLVSFHPDDVSKQIGMGADDLVGIYLCLEMLDSFENIKAAFFVEEEFGCKGAYSCDLEFLKDVGYFVEFDGPTNNWYTETLQGYPIYSKEFHKKVEKILETYKITNFSKDPYTDIVMVKKNFKVCSCNLPTGYFNWHKRSEYVDLEFMDNHINLGKEFIKTLGENKYPYEVKVEKYEYFIENEIKKGKR